MSKVVPGSKSIHSGFKSSSSSVLRITAFLTKLDFGQIVGYVEAKAANASGRESTVLHYELLAGYGISRKRRLGA
jgi:hypothetical protein